MIGIDLGTTRSCVAVMEGAVPQVIPNQGVERTTASVIAFEVDGKFRCVGSPAKRLASTIRERTVSAGLRLMARRYSFQGVPQAQRFLPYRLVETANGEMHVQLGSRV